MRGLLPTQRLCIVQVLPQRLNDLNPREGITTALVFQEFYDQLRQCLNDLNPREGITTLHRPHTGTTPTFRLNDLNPREGITTVSAVGCIQDDRVRLNDLNPREGITTAASFDVSLDTELV